jgi:Ca-activated chloride channel family protein
MTSTYISNTTRHSSLAKTARTSAKLSAIMIGLVLAIGCAGPTTNNKGEQAAQDEVEASQTVLANARQSEIQDNEQAHQASLVKERKRGEMVAQLSSLSAAPMAATSMPSRHMIPMHEQMQAPQENSENYQNIVENGIKQVSLEPVSTFSVDVDTGSYTNTRRMLNQGYLPPADAVRIEEFINYFDYNYATPKSADQPFNVNTAVSVAPWNENRHLLRIGLKGYQSEQLMSNGSNLVFLLDVSGSMNQANKLPLLKRSLTMLTNQLSDTDKVSIVVYAGASGVVLEPTNGNDNVAIAEALNKLQAGGSTNGSAGIQQAYQLAEQAFIEGGVNRVILATDGDFNVGMVDQNSLIELIKRKREKGIALTTLGFGQGNYNDYLMEQLADAGNGNYAYIDNINEARKVLVDELQSTMEIIAKDVKIQVEFNPQVVAEYRLIGYENRKLANEDFNNDKVDAGDIGAGHLVTALYELSLVNSPNQYVDDLRYSNKPAVTKANDLPLSGELAHIKLRYKAPNSNESQLISKIVKVEQIADFNAQSDDFRFAAAVASYAQRIKLSKFTSELGYDWIANTAQQAKGADEFGYRSEFIQLVRNTQQLAQVN